MGNSMPMTSSISVSSGVSTSGVFSKLWSGITGIFGRNKTSQNVAKTAPKIQDTMQYDRTAHINNNINRSYQPGSSQLSTPNTNSNTSVKLSSKSMDAVLLLQEAAGNWKSHQHLSNLLNIEWSALEAAKPNEVKEDAWMTLICIAYLTIVCSQHKSEWELIVQKAENWLKSVGANKSEWNQHAKQLIQQNQN